MAQQLIEQWRLAVLRVQLDLTDRIPSVLTELVSYPDRTAYTLWTRRHPLESFGLAEATEPPGRLRLPDDLRDGIAASLATDLEGEASLWLRLTPPYGYLGAVPWEESLLAVTQVPLFRVPDRLPVVAEHGQVWSMAIGVSAAAGSTWSAPYVAALVDSVAREVPTAADVHVFADAGTVDGLRALGVSAQPWLHVHEPRDAQRASRERSGRMTSRYRRTGGDDRAGDPSQPGQIWADWIAAGLAGQAVRALHVVVDATWDQNRPILALGSDPVRPTDVRHCSFVEADDVRRLADSLGAATLSFASPPDTASEQAVRMIADDLGQQRAGTTLHSAIRLDPAGAALAGMCGFLADRSGERALPRHPSLFAYLQPERVQALLAEPWPEPPVTRGAAGATSPGDDPLPSNVLPEGYRTTRESDLTDHYAGSDVVPSWVASSERYVGSQLANLSRSASAESVGYKQAYERGAAEALAELEQIVAKHARPS